MNKSVGSVIVWALVLMVVYSVFMGYVQYKEEISRLDDFSDGEFLNFYYDKMFFEYVGSKLLILAITVIIILIINIIKLYNKIVSLKEKFENVLSSIDVYLKQRFDLIPNLVETVKAYSNYEKETLESIIKLRTEFDINEKNVIAKSDLDNEYNNLIARIEAYPELKANENFLDLQKQLARMENQIQAARRTYNMQVTEYNILIKKFPNSIVANIFGYREQNLFEAKPEERNVVNV